MFLGVSQYSTVTHRLDVRSEKLTHMKDNSKSGTNAECRETVKRDT